MNVRQMLSNTPRGITVEMKAAAIDRIGRILDDASQDPEKFIRIVRTQLGRDERALFTYGHVRHRAEKGDTGAMALLAEFIRQERNDTLTPEEVRTANRSFMILPFILIPHSASVTQRPRACDLVSCIKDGRHRPLFKLAT